MNRSHIVTAISQSTFNPYPKDPPFLPDVSFPEFGHRIDVGKEKNPVYPLLRGMFVSHGFDVENYSLSTWNPLGALIVPGQTVLIKPNLVRHKHMQNGDYRTVVAHGSVIRGVLDYVALALQGKGKIIVGDAPVQSADFDLIVEKNFLHEICKSIQESWNIPVELYDFRLCETTIDENHKVLDRSIRVNNLTDFTAVNLKSHSLLSNINEYNQLFRVTNYDCGEMVTHHNENVHEYLIPNKILESDVIISIPKLKTHRKVGLTAGLKNLVGINGHKDWLPHHRRGAVPEGGDEYKNASILKKWMTSLIEANDKTLGKDVFEPYRSFLLRVLRRISLYIAKDHFEEGSWYGNDTLWRTVLDLNRLLIYADRKGVIQDKSQRQYFTIVDGIIAGEGEGPMEPDPVYCGMLVCGSSSLAVDCALASIIGFDYNKIPLIKNGFKIDSLPLVDFSSKEVSIIKKLINSDDEALIDSDISFNFTPPSGWQGHIEI